MTCCPHCNEPLKLYHIAGEALPVGEDKAITLQELNARLPGNRGRNALNELLVNAGPYLRMHGWTIQRKRDGIGRGGHAYVWKQPARLGNPVR